MLSRHMGWRLIAVAFLLIGIVCFIAAVIFAISSMVTCGGSCTGGSAFDLLLGEFKFMGLFCAGAIMLVVGLIAFTFFRWGLFDERVPWQEIHKRYRYRP